MSKDYMTKEYWWNRGTLAIVVVAVLYASGYATSFRTWVLRLLTFAIVIMLWWVSYRVYLRFAEPNYSNGKKANPEGTDKGK